MSPKKLSRAKTEEVQERSAKPAKTKAKAKRKAKAKEEDEEESDDDDDEGEFAPQQPQKSPKQLRKSKTVPVPKAPSREAKPSSTIQKDAAATQLQAVFRGVEVRKDLDERFSDRLNVAAMRAMYQTARAQFAEQKKNKLTITLKSTAKMMGSEAMKWRRSHQVVGALVESSARSKISQRSRQLMLKSLDCDDLDLVEEYIRELLNEIELAIKHLDDAGVDATELEELKEKLEDVSNNLFEANEARKEAIGLLDRLCDPSLINPERSLLQEEVKAAREKARRYGELVANQFHSIGIFTLGSETPVAAEKGDAGESEIGEGLNANEELMAAKLSQWEPEGYDQMIQESIAYSQAMDVFASTLQYYFRARQLAQQARRRLEERKSAIVAETEVQEQVTETEVQEQAQAEAEEELVQRPHHERHDFERSKPSYSRARTTVLCSAEDDERIEDYHDDLMAGTRLYYDLMKLNHPAQTASPSKLPLSSGEGAHGSVGEGANVSDEGVHKSAAERPAVVQIQERVRGNLGKKQATRDVMKRAVTADVHLFSSLEATIDDSIGDLPIKSEELSRKTPEEQRAGLSTRTPDSVLASRHDGMIHAAEQADLSSSSNPASEEQRCLSAAGQPRAGSVASGGPFTRPSTRAASAMTEGTTSTRPSTGLGDAELMHKGRHSLRTEGTVSPSLPMVCDVPIDEFVEATGQLVERDSSPSASDVSTVSSPEPSLTTAINSSRRSSQQLTLADMNTEMLAREITMPVDPWCKRCMRMQCTDCLALFPKEVVGKSGNAENVLWKCQIEDICGPEPFKSRFSEELPPSNTTFKQLSNRAFGVLERWGIQKVKNKYLNAAAEQFPEHDVKKMNRELEIATIRGIGRKPPTKRTNVEVDFLVQYLRRNCNKFFQAVPDRLISHTARYLQTRRFENGEVLWEEGDNASWVCVVLCGEISLATSSSSMKHSMIEHTVVGTPELVACQPPDFYVLPESERTRRYTATAVGRTDSLVLTLELLMEITEFHGQDSREKITDALRTLFRLTMRQPKLIPKMVDFWRLELFPLNHHICMEGHVDSLQEGRIVVIVEGEVVLKRKGKVVLTKARGSVLGEEALRGRTYRYTAICEASQVAGISISAQDYIQHVDKSKGKIDGDDQNDDEDDQNADAARLKELRIQVFAKTARKARTEADARDLDDKDWRLIRGKHKYGALSRKKPLESCPVERFAPESFTGVVSRVEVGLPTKCDLSPQARREWVATKGNPGASTASTRSDALHNSSWLTTSYMSATSDASDMSLSQLLNKSKKSYSKSKAQYEIYADLGQHIEDVHGTCLEPNPPVRAGDADLAVYGAMSPLAKRLRGVSHSLKGALTRPGASADRSGSNVVGRPHGRASDVRPSLGPPLRW